jgi:hypothetical protein
LAGAAGADGAEAAGAALAGPGTTGDGAIGAGAGADATGDGATGAEATGDEATGDDGTGAEATGDGAAGAAGCGAGVDGGGPGRGAAEPPEPLGNASRSRRATGASTVEDADFTNSPCSLSLASTVLLSIPSSFASSCTRALPGTGLLLVRPAASPLDP